MKVTVYQDTYCPWCYIGKNNLHQAVDQYDGDVEIEYKSYFLRPNIPKDGMNKDDYFKQKYDPDQIEEMDQNLEKKAKEAGVTINLEYEIIPNTLLSHRLIKLYPDKQEELLGSIYKEFFEKGKNIGKLEVLINIAKDVGLDPSDVRYQLEKTDNKKQEVWDDYEEAKRIGVRGVPFFVFNDEQVLQGAHKPEMILQVIRRMGMRKNIQFDLLN